MLLLHFSILVVALKHRAKGSATIGGGAKVLSTSL